MDLDFPDAGTPTTTSSLQPQRHPFHREHRRDGPLRVGLAWTDPPGDHLQNVLQLLVGHWRVPRRGGQRDPAIARRGEAGLNKTCGLRIEQPLSGDFVLQVQAQIARGSRAAVRACGHRPPHRSARRSRTLLRWGPDSFETRCGARGRRSRHTRATTPRRHLTRPSRRWRVLADVRSGSAPLDSRLPMLNASACCYSSTRRSPVTRRSPDRDRSFEAALREAVVVARSCRAAAEPRPRIARETWHSPRSERSLDAVARLQEALAATFEDSDHRPITLRVWPTPFTSRRPTRPRADGTGRGGAAAHIAATLAERALSRRMSNRRVARSAPTRSATCASGNSCWTAAISTPQPASFARRPPGRPKSYDETVYQRNLGRRSEPTMR